jgi:hypothetical protein
MDYTLIVLGATLWFGIFILVTTAFGSISLGDGMMAMKPTWRIVSLTGLIIFPSSIVTHILARVIERLIDNYYTKKEKEIDATATFQTD